MKYSSLLRIEKIRFCFPGRSIASIFGLLAYTFVFAEGFVRLATPQAIIPRYVEEAPWGVRSNVPNITYWQKTPEVSVQIRINAQRMRDDRIFQTPKPLKTCRIGLFGDSYFMGFELNLEETFAKKLEERLRAAGHRIEVLNFAVSGFGTAEMLRSYEGQARDFGIDLAIFSFYGDDYDDNVRSGLYRLVNGVAVPANETYLPAVTAQNWLLSNPVYRWIADNSQFYSLIRERVAVNVKQFLELLAVGQQDNGAANSYAIRLTAALLIRAQAEVHHDGAGFALVEIPTRISRTEFSSSLSNLRADVPSAILVISPLDAFKAAARPNLKLYYEMGHFHLSPLGTDILADVTIGAIERSAEFTPCLRAEQ